MSTNAQRPPQLGFNDFQPDATYESHARTVTESDISIFVGLVGLRLPVFIDEHYARTKGPFGTRIAPGFLTASIAGGMIESILGPDIIAGLGMEGFRFHAPVRLGDTVHTRVTVLARQPSRDGNRGVVTLRAQVLNQRGECVLTFDTSVLMRRPAGVDDHTKHAMNSSIAGQR